MAIPISGIVGPATGTDGSQLPIRQGKTGEVNVSELQPRYYEQAYRKNLYTAYAAAQATSLVGTAMVGLQIYNGSPVAGGVNLVIMKVGGFVAVTSASATGLVLATGSGQLIAPTGQTAATRVTNNFIGSQSPQGLALTGGTFTNAPTALLALMHNTAAIATTGEDQGYQFDLEGSLIIPPQSYVCVAALGAALSASGGFHHIMWAEVPV